MPRLRQWLPEWRREALRTTLWLVPALLVTAVGLFFMATYTIDRAAYDGHFTLPSFVLVGSADAARQLLSAIAAAVITVVGVVFSVTIVSLTLASQQFGPRMLRNFIRDLGTQVSLGAFVATFVYAVLTFGAINGTGRRGPFVPDLSVTAALAMLLVDLGVLIYFIHHITVSIQLPQVIASISRDLGRAIDVQFGPPQPNEAEPSTSRVRSPALAGQLATTERLLEREGVVVETGRSGYLQVVRIERLVEMATATDSVIKLLHRPGHFLTAGLPLARVWPPQAGPAVAASLQRAHVPGAHRTLTQDPVYPIDQLVEIASRALSASTNDPFTALTCIDWLTDALCKISVRALPSGVHLDADGRIRVIELGPDYTRIVNRAIDKIRQSSRGVPAVAIRLIEGLTKVVVYTRSDDQRRVLAAQAERIMRAGRESFDEADDLEVLEARYRTLLAAFEQRSQPAPAIGP